MNKVTFVKVIVKAYFVTALVFSFSHFITAASKVGLYGVGAYSMPIAIDGLALVGMIMRSRDFDDATNRIGLWMQMICGTASLAVNVFAGNTRGESVQGATWVLLYIVLESLVGKIRSRAAAVVAQTSAFLAECRHPRTCSTVEQCTRKAETAAKSARTRARKARQRKAQVRALEELVNV